MSLYYYHTSILPQTHRKRTFPFHAHVVVHKAAGVAGPMILFIDMLQRVQKVEAVLIALEDGFTCIAAGSDMINSTGALDTERTGHDGQTIAT
jgi:hypothetical protein